MQKVPCTTTSLLHPLAPLQGLARWAPEMALAAGALPPLKVRPLACRLA